MAIELYDRRDLEELFKCSSRTARRRFNAIKALIPLDKIKAVHDKVLPEYYVKLYLGIPDETIVGGNKRTGIAHNGQ